MKKLIPLLFILVSCQQVLINSPSIELDEAWKQTASFEYIYNDPVNFKQPWQFERDGGGDCEDFALYLCWLLGDDATVIVIEYATGPCHAIVKYRGEYLEPQRYGMYYKELPDHKAVYEYTLYFLLK